MFLGAEIAILSRLNASASKILFATQSFTNSSTPNEIEKYLDFLDSWYENHQSELQSGELEKFKNKVEGVRKEWPFKVSHLVLLGMRRQSKPDKR